MDAVLINPYPWGIATIESDYVVPLGLGYIAAVLEQNEYKCRIIDAYSQKLNDFEILECIPDNTKMVGFYLDSFSFNSVLRLADKIKEKRKNIVIICLLF